MTALVRRVGPAWLGPLRPWLRRIPRDGVPYLDRYSLRRQRADTGGGWRVYLHHFVSDDGPELHNHPWYWSFSVILRRRYTEQRLGVAGERVFRRGNINWIWGDTFHRVYGVPPDGCWTLFVCGPLHGRGWGFLPGIALEMWRRMRRQKGARP